MLNVPFIFLLIGLQASIWNLSKTGVAIEGYDPVSYFSSSPKEGSSAHSLAYRGATFYFSSAQNQELFRRNPDKYLPQYGGFCAYAMGESGEKVSIDPETYQIRDGKLYLFYNAWGTNTLKKWEKDEANLFRQAESNWRNIIGMGN